jgi:hypothetical protein
MRLRITLGSRVLSWLTEDRIAVVKRGKPTTVRIVSVSQRKVIHREVLRARLSDTARVGDRQVTLNAVKNGDEQTLSVFNADGVLERTVALPGMVSGTLHGRTPTGQALVLSGEEALAYAVDVVTGDVVRHDLDLPQGGYEWLEPTRGDMLAVDNFDDVWILDPATFGVVRKVEATGVIKGAGEGFAAYDTEGEADLVVYGPDGEQRWSVPKLNLLDLAAFGDRLYAGSGYDDVHIREYDLVTGKRVGKLRGRASLFEASAGRVRVPFFSSSAISED